MSYGNLRSPADPARPRRWRRVSLAALAALMASGAVSARAAGAATPTSVTPGTVTPADPTAGANSASYSVAFTTSSAGDLATGGTITFVGPDGTAFSGCTSSCSYGIAVNHGHSATVSSVAVSKVAAPGQGTVSSTPNQAVLTLGSSTIGAGDAVTVTTSSVENPITAGTYSLEESTSADTSPANSPGYNIIAGAPMKVVATGGDNQSTAVGTKFPVALTATVVDSHGNPVTTGLSTDKVSFSAPGSGASLTFSTTASEADSIGSNGQSTSSVPTANSTSGSYSVTATLVSGGTPVAGVGAGSFSLANGTAVSSPPHVTPGSVALSNQTENQSGVTYTIPFRTSPAGGLANGATITLVAPNGTSLPPCPALCSSSVYSIAVSNGHSATVSSVTASSTGPSPATNKVVITLLLSSISFGDTVTVTITGVGNPTLAGTQNQIAESTSADTSPASSPAYTINPGAATHVVAISGGAQSAQFNSQFAAPLVAEVEDSNGNGIGGIHVTFTIGSAGGANTASANFANTTATEDDLTNPTTGRATTSLLTANQYTGGPYSVTASVTNPAGVTSATFSGLANTAGQVAPDAISFNPNPPTVHASNEAYTIGFTTSATGGLPSGGTVTLVAPNGTAWPSQKAHYSPSGSQTVSGVSLSAVAGPGASAVSTTDNQVVITLGTAVPAATFISFAIDSVTNPDTSSNAFVVKESTSADNTVADSPVYGIVPAAPTTIVRAPGNNGNGQSAAPGATFSQPLAALVTDPYGNPVEGVQVTFQAPTAAGPGATFGTCPVAGSTSTKCIVDTAANGTATSSVLTADSTPGGFNVPAAASGVVTPATFSLTIGQVLTPLAVSVSPATAGSSSAVYTIPLVTSSSGAIPSSGTCPGGSGTNCQISLIAPNGTSLPASSGSYQVAVSDSHAATLSDVSVSAVQGPGATVVSSTPNQAVLTFDASSIAGGDTVTVTISGVTNPTVASTAYTFLESTSSDSSAVGSPSYTIGAAPAQTVTVVAGNPQSATVQTPYLTMLEVQVSDAYGNPVPGETITFGLPPSGPSGTFGACPGAGSTSTSCVVTTDSMGDASAQQLTANGTAGPFSVTVTATSANGTLSGSPTFALTNLAGGPQTITITSGDNQSQPVGGQYSNPLQVTVLDKDGNPVVGVPVTFRAPAYDSAQPNATVSFAGGCGVGNPDAQTCEVETTAPNGVATSSNLTANTVAGAVPVTVTAGAPTAKTFHLTNVAGPPATINLADGTTPQSATTNTPYGTDLGVQIVDAYNNPISGLDIAFSTPSSGASATFASCPGTGSSPTNCVETTDANGDATASTLTANGLAGEFSVLITTDGFSGPAFDLTNVHNGYWMVGSDGGIFNLGDAPFYGSAGGTHLNQPVVGMAEAQDGNGYYLVASDGGVFAFGPGAPYAGSEGGSHLNAPIVGIAVDPLTGGYWLAASDGGVFNFGGAPFYGSHGGAPLNKPIVGIGAAPDGGYYLVASDGGIFNYGAGAPYLGSHGNAPLNKPIVGMAVDPVTGGYWLVAKDGGIFNYGGAPFDGSEGSTQLNAPIVGMASSG